MRRHGASGLRADHCRARAGGGRAQSPFHGPVQLRVWCAGLAALVATCSAALVLRAPLGLWCYADRRCCCSQGSRRQPQRRGRRGARQGRREGQQEAWTTSGTGGAAAARACMGAADAGAAGSGVAGGLGCQCCRCWLRVCQCEKGGTVMGGGPGGRLAGGAAGRVPVAAVGAPGSHPHRSGSTWTGSHPSAFLWLAPCVRAKACHANTPVLLQAGLRSLPQTQTGSVPVRGG
mmetsp:Transcript_101476/g.282436  ORF Transcript_101476/g.282436 Transcript_101476/m.282436 type:complete len:233 (-) Transcript_101476:38-736(-)